MRPKLSTTLGAATLTGALALGGVLPALGVTQGFGQRSCPATNVYTAGYDKGSAKKEHWGNMITTSKTFPYSSTFVNNAFQDVGRKWISGGQAYASISIFSLYEGCL